MKTRTAALLALALGTTPAYAQEFGWAREDFDNGVQVTLVGNENDALAAVRCIDGEELNIFFQVTQGAVDPALKADDGFVTVVLRVDDTEFEPVESELFVSIEDFVAAEYFGEDAEDWARAIAGARSEIAFSYGLARDPGERFNAEVFPVRGSTATTNEILEICVL